MVCRSMLASDSGEMDSALFLLSRGVSRGLEKRDTGQEDTERRVRDGVKPSGLCQVGSDSKLLQKKNNINSKKNVSVSVK